MVNSLTSSGLFARHFSCPDIAVLFKADAIVAHMMQFERAWTQALADAGMFEAGAAQQALAAMEAFEPDLAAIAQAADRDGLPVPELVRQIKTAAGEAASGAIHKGATSQDLIDSALMIALKRGLGLIAQQIETALAALDKLAQSHGPNSLMGHTRMQAALPITVADRARVWRAGLMRAMDHTPEFAMQFGGPVGDRRDTGGQAEAIAEHLATALGLANAPCWHAERSRITAIGHWMMQASGACGKIGQDIALMAQTGQVKLSGAGGSSAMAHKQNPVRAESIVSVARYVGGQQGTLAQALVHEQERSGAGWGLEWMLLPSMCEATGAATVNLCALFAQIEHLGDPA